MASFAIPLIASLALAAALPSHALSCWPTPLRDTGDRVHAKWSQADAVFVGRLRTLVQTRERPRGGAAGGIHDVHTGTFEVVESFKGHTPVVEAMAPGDLRPGESYVVFANRLLGLLHTRTDCGLQPNDPVPLADARAEPTLAALRALPRAGEGAVLYVKVHADRRLLDGMPVFLEGPAGSRVVALDHQGVARVPGLPPGDYRIQLQGSAHRVTCMWSPQCGPVRLADRELAIAVLQVLRPTSVSSSR